MLLTRSRQIFCTGHSAEADHPDLQHQPDLQYAPGLQHQLDLQRDVGTLSVPVIAVAEETDAGAASSSDLSVGGLAIVARELGNHLKSLLLVIVTLKDEAIPFFSPFSVVDD